jgi:hypothetical protein
MKKVVSALAVWAAIVSASTLTDARDKPLTGAWTLSAQGLSLRMMLSQQGRIITGTLDYPHGAPFQLKNGVFEAGSLKFSGDSSGEGFVIHIDASGSLQSDGSLAGTITSRITDLDKAGNPLRTLDQNMTWKAVRTSSK